MVEERIHTMAKVVITEDGTKKFSDDEHFWHREDGPAIISKNCHYAWYYRGRPHRDNAPAIYRSNGMYWWCIKGWWHHEERPAEDHPNGRKRWWKNGKLVWPEL